MCPGLATCDSLDALFVGPDRAAGRLEAATPCLLPEPRLPGAAGGPRGPPHSGNLKGPADEVPGALAGGLQIPVPVAALLGDEAKPPVGGFASSPRRAATGTGIWRPPASAPGTSSAGPLRFPL